MLPPIIKNPTAHQALNYIMQSVTPSPMRPKRILEQLANIIREELDNLETKTSESEPKVKFINADSDTTVAATSAKLSDDEIYGLKRKRWPGFDIFTNTNFDEWGTMTKKNMTTE